LRWCRRLPRKKMARACSNLAAACHSLDPAERGMPGPNLAGLIGRKVGSDPALRLFPGAAQGAR